MLTVPVMPEFPSGHHIPVLTREVTAALSPRPGGVYIDATFGGGGHSLALLRAAPCTIIGIDRDGQAIETGLRLLSSAGVADRTTLVEGRFADMETLARPHINGQVDGILLDLGVSSMQLDQGARGFSFRHDGPLDMRMDGQGASAAELVNRLERDALADILATLGEERRARTLARAIVAARSAAPLERTLTLANVIAKAAGPGAHRGRIHPATRSFQALRMAVNGELAQLAAGLEAAERLLAIGGRLAVISFHSLEDRMVKQFLAARTGAAARSSRHRPSLPERPPASFVSESPKAITVGQDELQANRRARSARLRTARRTQAPAQSGDWLDARLSRAAALGQKRPAR